MEFCGALLYTALIVITINIQEISSQPRFVFPVWFNPFVSETNHVYSYDGKGLLPIISTIATRFEKIMADYDDTSSRGFVPSAVATYNKLYGAPQNEPIELLPTFGFWFVRPGSNVTKFDVLQQKSDEANKIYPGTVKELYFAGYDHLNNRTVADITKYLTYVQSQLKNTTYELGSLFPFSKCGSSSRLPNYLPPILPLVKKLFFYGYPDQRNLQQDPKLATQHIIRVFKECVQRVKTYDKKISVGLFTGWVNSNETYNIQNDINLVTYWKSISDWAEEFHTPVVLDRAFDIPNPSLRTQYFMYTGWWRLIENSSYYDSSQYVFEEKQAKIGNATTEQAGDKEFDSAKTASFQIWYYIADVALFLLVLFTAALIILRKRLCRLLRNDQPRQENIVNLQESSSAAAIIKGNACIKELQLPKSSFKIDWNLSLGKGAFGVVYSGTVKYLRKDGELKVAVKTTCPSSPSTTILDFLTEIKVLSHLGKHDNIVNIVGAYTKGFKKGKVYIFLELSELGSLEKYLREAISKIDIQEEQRIHLSSPDEGTHLSDAEQLQGSPSYAKDLQRWSLEIATAMEFLASKHVVHADLATRNVLLTHDMRAKVSDFGLSRRMYEYSMYKKTQQEPLPRRWMSPEALRRLKFDEKSDVWSFGVTLWEIYSLGEVPFVGLSWTPDYNSQVWDGLRLPEPPLAKDGMYSIMLKCWSIDAANVLHFPN